MFYFWVATVLHLVCTHLHMRMNTTCQLFEELALDHMKCSHKSRLQGDEIIMSLDQLKEIITSLEEHLEKN